MANSRRPGDQTYAETVSEAVNHFSESGYTSPEDLEYWNARIRAAAERELIPAQILNDTLRSVLTQTYKRLIDDGGIYRTAPGVERFTIDRLRPELRAELDKRIVSSAQLIKLNREKAIEDTLRRFSGWATSIPKSGEANPEKRKTTQDIKKSMKSLPFTERRVLIDQGHKLTAAISDVVAVGGGAIAGMWESHWKQSNYDYRVSHKDRDKKIYLIRGSWADKQGLVKPLPRIGYTDGITQPGEEVFCFPGDSQFNDFGIAEKLYRRVYVGELVTLTTSSGKTLRATPNHPVMTSNGWCAVGLLNEGDNIVELIQEDVKSTKLYTDQTASTFSDFYDSMVQSGFPHEVSNGVSVDFHGDVPDSDVDIVSLAGPLTIDIVSTCDKRVTKLSLSYPDTFRTCLTRIFQCFDRLGTAANSVMRFFQSSDLVLTPSFVQGSKLLDTEENTIPDRWFGNTERIRKFLNRFSKIIPISNLVNRQFDLRSGSNINPSLGMPVPDSHWRDTDCISDELNGLSISSHLVDVVHIDRRLWSGHVYNLQTVTGWYSVSGIIVSNCRCRYKYIFSLRDLPPEMLTKKGAAALAEAKKKVDTMMAGA